MKPIVFVVLLLVCLGSVAVAQDVPRYEISGAATFLRDPANANRYGWLGSFARNVNDWFAVKGEAAGYYSKENARISHFRGGTAVPNKQGRQGFAVGALSCGSAKRSPVRVPGKPGSQDVFRNGAGWRNRCFVEPSVQRAPGRGLCSWIPQQ